MINLLININVVDHTWFEVLPEYKALSNSTLKKTFNYVKKHAAPELLSLTKPFAIGLTLTNDQQVQELNKEYRNLDKPTNVLSFAMIDDPDFSENCKIFDEIELGDIIISLQTLQKEALAKNISLSDHFCHLLIHGTLHLLGYDHIQDQEAEEMEDIEINVLKTFKINNPYEQ